MGIVGRTGSGKSTLLLTLMRILDTDYTNKLIKARRNPKSKKIEEKNQDGHIEISGRKIEEMGLHQLRKGLTIIPQNPFLLKGTLRRNVDPREEFTSEQIVEALKKVKFYSTLKEETFTENLQEGVEQAKKESKKVYSLEEKLEFKIESSGNNLSLG